jgi:hypothetical protein
VGVYGGEESVVKTQINADMKQIYADEIPAFAGMTYSPLSFPRRRESIVLDFWILVIGIYLEFVILDLVLIPWDSRLRGNDKEGAGMTWYCHSEAFSRRILLVVHSRNSSLCSE